MEDKKRMAGSYEIIQAFHIGDREIVLGEDINAKPEERYMCAYCQQSEIAALYTEVIVSDDYCEGCPNRPRKPVRRYSAQNFRALT